MISVSNLYKSYGSVQALRGVNFQIDAGEIIGLLGPNGAGKTTIIKTLTGYLQPDEGEVLINGRSAIEDRLAVQTDIGYLPENAPLYTDLTVQSYLKMVAGIRQIPETEWTARISEAVYATGIAPYIARPINQLSKGYRQRVGLAQAILHKPRLLILDEPTVGLDPTQIVEIRSLIKRLAQNSTILFSTHILSEVEALCDRVIMVMQGEVKLDTRLSELANTNNAVLMLDHTLPTDEPDPVRTVLLADEAIETVQAMPNNGQTRYVIGGTVGADLTPKLYQLATAQGWAVRELRRDVQTLESVFNRIALGETALPTPIESETIPDELEELI